MESVITGLSSRTIKVVPIHSLPLDGGGWGGRRLREPPSGARAPLGRSLARRGVDKKAKFPLPFIPSPAFAEAASRRQAPGGGELFVGC